MVAKNVEELKKVIRYQETDLGRKPKVVLGTGTFDLFHFDHLKYLQGAKKHGDILVVAVKCNEAARLKGEGRPIIDEKYRVEIVDNIKCVDYSIIAHYNSETKLEVEADNQEQMEWLYNFQELLKELRPDILYYEKKVALQTARERIFERYGITGVSKPRGTNASTTEIIEKIKK